MNSTLEIFVRLLDEGTDVLRPARAVACGGMRYRLLQPENYDPDDERWEFPPGSEVQGHVEVRAGREVLIADAPDTSRRTEASSDASISSDQGY